MKKNRLSGYKQNRLKEHFVAGATARYVPGKTPVFGLLKRHGRIHTVIISNT